MTTTDMGLGPGKRGDAPATVAPGGRAGRRPMLRISLSAVLAVGFTALITVAVGSALVLGFVAARESTLALVRDRVGVILSTVSDRLEAHLRQVEDQMSEIREAVVSGSIDPSDGFAFATFVRGALAATPQLSGIAFVKPDFKVERYSRDDRRIAYEDWSNRAPISDAIEYGRAQVVARWSPPVWSQPLKQAILPIVQPLHGRRGFAGVLIGYVTSVELSRFLDRVSTEIGQTSFVLYDQTDVLAHPRLKDGVTGTTRDRPLPQFDQIGDPVLAAVWDRPREPLTVLQDLPGVSGHRVSLPDGDVLFLFRPAAKSVGALWLIGTYAPGEIAADEMRQLKRTGMIGLAILVAAIGVSLWMGRRLGAPILRLAAAAERLRSADLDKVEPLPGSHLRELDQASQAFNHMVEGLRDRQRIRDLFGRYVPAEVAAEAIASPDTSVLGGARREISLIFTDIEDFTTLSEALSPEQVVSSLNDYFEELCAIIAMENGTVVDFIGDAVFAIFGAPVAAPDHAARAIACARRISDFARRFAAESRATGLPFGRTRIGVHSGTAMVGNLGAPTRLKYGAMGDSVNTAARLQSANKLFGTRVLSSRAAADKAADSNVRPVGALMLRGRSRPEEVVELLVPAIAREPWVARYRQAYEQLVSGAPEALEAFRLLAQERPGDGVVRVHLDRLESGTISPVVTV